MSVHCTPPAATGRLMCFRRPFIRSAMALGVGALAAAVVLGVVALPGVAALGRQSLLYGILEVAGLEGNKTDVDSCSRRLATLRRGIDLRELWALKMLDASGSPGSGFLWGNNYWLGSLTQCRDLHDRTPLITARTLHPAYTANPRSWPDFPVEFYMATFRHNSSLQEHVGLPNEDLVSVGLCLPDVCSAQDIARLLRTLTTRTRLLIQDVFDVEMSLEKVRSLREDNSWLQEPKFIIMAVILLTVIVLMVAGTLYDVFYWQPYLRNIRRENARNINKSQKIVENINNNNNNNEPVNLGQQAKCTKPSEKKPQQGELARFLVSFSIYTNTGVLLDTTISPDSVGAIHGLRFMGMGWILMVHTIFYMADYADNKPLAFRMGTGFMVQVISNSTLSTDTFFCISGFLVAYLFYKGRKGKTQNKITLKSQVNDFGLMVLRRFVRLTPAYMIILGILDVNMSWRSRTSVFHMTERADEICSKFWWRNLLYINNLFTRDEMCMSWSWYLSNDMQFFIIGSFLLVLSTSMMALSATFLTVMVIGSSVLSGFISYGYGYVPTLDQQLSMLNILYDPPWVRIGPYLVGLFTGYLVVRLDGKLHLNKCTVAMLWVLGSACNLVALFGLYDRNITPLTSALYVAVSRTVWGIGLAWIIVACCTNRAGFINRILSYPAWIPLSRLTYCAYLLNPLLINSIYLSSETALHISFLPMCTYFMGHLMTTYFCAYVASLAFETPTVLLMRRVVNSRFRNSET